LSPCSWRDEDFARLEKLPRKDDPVSSFTPRDAAWFLVEEGLKKVVAQAVSRRGPRDDQRTGRETISHKYFDSL
jgi:hypothetical protein